MFGEKLILFLNESEKWKANIVFEWKWKADIVLNESEKVKIERKMPNYYVSADNFGHKIEYHDAGRSTT